MLTGSGPRVGKIRALGGRSALVVVVVVAGGTAVKLQQNSPEDRRWTSGVRSSLHAQDRSWRKIQLRRPLGNAVKSSRLGHPLDGESSS